MDFHLPVKNLIQIGLITLVILLLRNNGLDVIINKWEKLETIASNALL